MKLRTSMMMVMLALPAITQAAALSRTEQPTDYIFEPGNNVNIGVGWVSPDVQGQDLIAQQYAPVVQRVTGATLDTSTGKVAQEFTQFSGSAKFQITPNVHVALGYEQPFGIDVKYNASAPVLNKIVPMVQSQKPGAILPPTGGMEAHASAEAITALVGYKTDSNFWVYGGPVYYRVGGGVKLPNAGYSVNMPYTDAWGYTLGAAWEKPEIALRAALTYHSSAKYSQDGTETVAGRALPSHIDFTLPQSVNLDFQTGIAPKTLLISGVRWVNWKQFSIAPKYFGMNPAYGKLVDFANDSWYFKLGVGRQFTDKFSGQVVLSYDTGNGSPVSPLGPPNDGFGVMVGGKYAFNKNVDLSAGVRYIWFKDQTTASGKANTPVGRFSDMNVFGAGMKLGIHF